jgi:hypothetical protein
MLRDAAEPGGADALAGEGLGLVGGDFGGASQFGMAIHVLHRRRRGRGNQQGTYRTFGGAGGSLICGDRGREPGW